MLGKRRKYILRPMGIVLMKKETGISQLHQQLLTPATESSSYLFSLLSSDEKIESDKDDEIEKLHQSMATKTKALHQRRLTRTIGSHPHTYSVLSSSGPAATPTTDYNN